jgi:hypothetical protein
VRVAELRVERRGEDTLDDVMTVRLCCVVFFVHIYYSLLQYTCPVFRPESFIEIVEMFKRHDFEIYRHKLRLIVS